MRETEIAEANKPVADNIKEYLSKNSIAHSYAAAICGYSKQQFSDMLNGRKLMKCSDIITIAKKLNISIERLYYGSTQTNNSASITLKENGDTVITSEQVSFSPEPDMCVRQF